MVGRMFTRRDRPYVYQAGTCGTIPPDLNLPGGEDHGATTHEPFARHHPSFTNRRKQTALVSVVATSVFFSVKND